MVAIYEVEAGDEIIDEDVNQYSKWWSGDASITNQPAILSRVSDPAMSVLTLRHLDDEGTSLSVLDLNDIEQIKIHRQKSSNIWPAVGGDYQFFETINLGENGKIVSRTGGSPPIHSHMWDVYRSDAESGTISFEIVQDNNFIGTATEGDAATVAFLGRRFHGDGYWRTMELDAINLTDGGSTQPFIGIELTVETVQNGNGTINDTTGISIQNMGDLWEFGSPWKAVDNGLLIGGISSHRITYPIRVGGNGTDVTLGLYSAGTELFRVNYLGTVESGHALPRSDSAFDLGSLTANWRYSWVDTYHSTLGISTTLAHYELGATNTGWGLPAANTICAFNNSTETFRIDANENVICGTTGLATNATDGFFYVRAMAGAPSGTPSIGSGRCAITVNTVTGKLCFWNGSSWVSVP